TASQSEMDTASQSEMDTASQSEMDTASQSEMDTASASVEDTGTWTGIDTVDTETGDSATDTEFVIDSDNCVVGTFQITTALESDAFVGVTCIRGNLTIGPSAAALDISLPQLTVIDGELYISRTQGQCAVLLENLTTVTTVAVSYNRSVSLSVPSLITIEEALAMEGNGVAGEGEIEMDLRSVTEIGAVSMNGNETASFSVDLGSLKTIRNNLISNGNMGINALKLSNLETVSGYFLISSASGLGQLDLSRLTAAKGGITITANEQLADIDMGLLQHSEGTIVIASNPNLASINLDSLRAVTLGSFVISMNEKLSTLKLSTLETVDESVFISENDIFDCDAAEFTDRIQTPEIAFCENLPNGTCGDAVCPYD
ncbi:MAG: hypothetical protein JXX14_21780, partial [Deltaproteobacteria bacterium]|nr:hypothetical protein [Deltaproteobacteria bacterium]